jgi:predicted RNase H-like HicB family nuclease
MELQKIYLSPKPRAVSARTDLHGANTGRRSAAIGNEPSLLCGSFVSMDKMLMLNAVVHQEGEWFVANCPELGTVSQGRTYDEAVHNLREATELYLGEFGTTSASSLQNDSAFQ